MNALTLRTRRSVRGLGWALLVHVVTRGVGLAVLLLMAHTAAQDPVGRLSVWDGGWYVRIAQDGYAQQLDLTEADVGSLAFYPLYPLLLRWISALTGFAPATSGVLVSELAAAVAAAGLYLLASRLWNPAVGIALVLLWSAQPVAVVLSMVYTEALFSAFAVWSLVCLQRHYWLTAGVLALIAGLTRTSGLGVGLAVTAYVLWCWWRDPDRGPRPLAAAFLALLGTPLWWAWVGWRTSQLDGWFVVQDAVWQTRWDWGVSTLNLGLGVFSGAIRYGGNAVFVVTLTFALLVVAVVLLAATVYGRVWWPLVVYAAVLLAMTIGTAGFINAKPRFLVPIFPLLIPLALALARARRAVQVVVGALVIAASAWLGAFLLVIWEYSI